MNTVRAQILKENLLDDPLGFEKLPMALVGLAVLGSNGGHGFDVTNKFPVVVNDPGKIEPDAAVAMGLDALCFFLNSQAEYRSMKLEKFSLELGKCFNTLALIY